MAVGLTLLTFDGDLLGDGEGGLVGDGDWLGLFDGKLLRAFDGDDEDIGKIEGEDELGADDRAVLGTTVFRPRSAKYTPAWVGTDVKSERAWRTN